MSLKKRVLKIGCIASLTLLVVGFFAFLGLAALWLV